MTESEFYEWFDNLFGYGYGTGEPHVLRALKAFFSLCEKSRDSDYPHYKYEALEARLGPEATWLIINALCKDGTIEYGTSPRYGWIARDRHGICELFRERTVEELVDMYDRENEKLTYG